MLGIDLQDQAPGAVGGNAENCITDGVCLHVVKEAADLEDLDKPGSLNSRIYPVVVLGTCAGPERTGEKDGHYARNGEDADHYARHQMDPSDFFTAARVLIVAGKGGVGKTTIAATLGVAASQVGIDTLLVEIEGKRGLGSLFAETPLLGAQATPLPYDDTELIAGTDTVGRLRARTVLADSALMDYLEEHGLKEFGRTLSKLQVLDTLATSTPGLKDLIVLGKIKQLELNRDAELIIVDAPASGHAISFLRAARGLQTTIQTGPIQRQADDVVDMLTNPARTQVLLVTLAEETPVNELVETAYALEDEVGVRLGPAIINAVHEDRLGSTSRSRSKTVSPVLARQAADAAAYWTSRTNSQSQQVARLSEELPLEQLVLPRRLGSRLGRDDIAALSAALLAQIEALRFRADT